MVLQVGIERFQDPQMEITSSLYSDLAVNV